MTPEEINIAIAEACGWTEIEVTAPSRGSLAPRFKGMMPGHKRSEDDLPRLLPNYYGDLNACHDMEEVLTEEELREFRYQLAGIVSNWNGDIREAVYKSIHATAPQRCESFLKAKKL
jgi:hypothetical protein